jgi:3-deoxy-manno-octulosonate cytidylyltransferase (CMP-KDO synthetase)
MIPEVETVAVATDHQEIFRTVEHAGFTAIMTSADHVSGTDRVAEAAEMLCLDDGDMVVNIQGDQPLLETGPVRAMIEMLASVPDFHMTTAACPLEADDLNNPNRVKVVLDRRGGAIYFSRAPIPFDRDGVTGPVSSGVVEKGFPGYLRHLGLYAFRYGFLRTFVSLEQGILERIEMLEQLRAIENGFSIGVAVVANAPVEVDTHDDLEAVRRKISSELDCRHEAPEK